MDSLEMIATLHRSLDQSIYKAKVRLNSFLFSVICCHVDAVDWPSGLILQTSDWESRFKPLPLVAFLERNIAPLCLFSPTLLGELIIILLKGVGGGHTTNRGLRKKVQSLVTPVIGSSWPFTFLSCFNYKGMVSIHKIHLINQYYSNMFAVFIV